MTARIRPFREKDGKRLEEVLAAVFLEYGMTFDPDGWDRDVREAHVKYAEPSGVFFAAEEDGEVLGFAGADLPHEGAAEVHRLYLDPRARGKGLGARLCTAVEEWARGKGIARMELWSDLRFFHAHAMYAKRGYRLFGMRTLDDPDRSVEFGFARSLGGEMRPERHDALDAKRTPLAAVLADPARAHAASMMAAAILDARTLVREGRMVGTRHELPSPCEVFAGGATSGEVAALTVVGGALAGFERVRGGERVTRLHPLFSGDGRPSP